MNTYTSSKYILESILELSEVLYIISGEEPIDYNLIPSRIMYMNVLYRLRGDDHLCEKYKNMIDCKKLDEFYNKFNTYNCYMDIINEYKKNPVDIGNLNAKEFIDICKELSSPLTELKHAIGVDIFPKHEESSNPSLIIGLMGIVFIVLLYCFFGFMLYYNQ